MAGRLREGESRRIHVVKDDPDDDKFIECAVECGAEFS